MPTENEMVRDDEVQHLVEVRATVCCSLEAQSMKCVEKVIQEE